MAGINDGLRRELGDLFQSSRQLGRIRKWQIGATNRPGEKTIANERDSLAVYDDMPGRMTRRVHHRHLPLSNSYHLTVAELVVGWRGLLEWHSVHLGLSGGRIVQSPLERMEIDRHVPLALYRRDRAHVIDVRVRYPDSLELRSTAIDRIDETITFTTGIDDHRVVSPIIHDQVAVLLKRSDGDGFDFHV